MTKESFKKFEVLKMATLLMKSLTEGINGYGRSYRANYGLVGTFTSQVVKIHF